MGFFERSVSRKAKGLSPSLTGQAARVVAQSVGKKVEKFESKHPVAKAVHDSLRKDRCFCGSWTVHAKCVQKQVK